jgi:hypothetical protein
MFAMRRTSEGYLYIMIDNKAYFVRMGERGLYIQDNKETFRIKLDSEGMYYMNYQDDKVYILTDYDQQVLAKRNSRGR